MSAVERAAEVLADHRPCSCACGMCACGWGPDHEGEDIYGHQAEALAAAALLPTEGETRTEWSLRWPSGSVGDPHPREEFVRRAQRDDYPDTTVLRREVGPWVEVPS